MVRQRGFVEEKMIKKMDAVGSCEELDVKAAVMKRVRAIHEQQNRIDGERTSMVSELKPFPEPEDPIMQKQRRCPNTRLGLEKECSLESPRLYCWGLSGWVLCSCLNMESYRNKVASLQLISQNPKVVLLH